VENSEISESYLKAIVDSRQAVGLNGIGQVPKYRHENRGAKRKRRKNGHRDWHWSAATA